MFASISHELRTPLNGIVGLTELVLASSECTEDSRRRLDVVKSQAMRLNSLVDDILDAASNKRGHLIVKNGRCDLREISENVCMMVQPLVSSKVQLINNMSVGGDAIIDGDSNRISQILTNLLGNAIKFTKSGSITIRNRTGRDLVVVEVVDTGIGIADEKLEKIWDAFESEDELADSKYASSGLGLSLVKSLVEAHRGSCWVSSRCGEEGESGTTFAFSLPRTQTQSRSQPSQAPPVPARGEAGVACSPTPEDQAEKEERKGSVDAEEVRRSVDALGVEQGRGKRGEGGGRVAREEGVRRGEATGLWHLSINSEEEGPAVSVGPASESGQPSRASSVQAGSDADAHTDGGGGRGGGGGDAGGGDGEGEIGRAHV